MTRKSLMKVFKRQPEFQLHESFMSDNLDFLNPPSTTIGEMKTDLEVLEESVSEGYLEDRSEMVPSPMLRRSSSDRNLLDHLDRSGAWDDGLDDEERSRQTAATDGNQWVRNNSISPRRQSPRSKLRNISPRLFGRGSAETKKDVANSKILGELTIGGLDDDDKKSGNEGEDVQKSEIVYVNGHATVVKKVTETPEQRPVRRKQPRRLGGKRRKNKDEALDLTDIPDQPAKDNTPSVRKVSRSVSTESFAQFALGDYVPVKQSRAKVVAKLAEDMENIAGDDSAEEEDSVAAESDRSNHGRKIRVAVRSKAGKSNRRSSLQVENEVRELLGLKPTHIESSDDKEDLDVIDDDGEESEVQEKPSPSLERTVLPAPSMVVAPTSRTPRNLSLQHALGSTEKSASVRRFNESLDVLHDIAAASPLTQRVEAVQLVEFPEREEEEQQPEQQATEGFEMEEMPVSPRRQGFFGQLRRSLSERSFSLSPRRKSKSERCLVDVGDAPAIEVVRNEEDDPLVELDEIKLPRSKNVASQDVKKQEEPALETQTDKPVGDSEPRTPAAGSRGRRSIKAKRRSKTPNSVRTPRANSRGKRRGSLNNVSTTVSQDPSEGTKSPAANLALEAYVDGGNMIDALNASPTKGRRSQQSSRPRRKTNVVALEKSTTSFIDMENIRDAGGQRRGSRRRGGRKRMAVDKASEPAVNKIQSLYTNVPTDNDEGDNDVETSEDSKGNAAAVDEAEATIEIDDSESEFDTDASERVTGHEKDEIEGESSVLGSENVDGSCGRVERIEVLDDGTGTVSGSPLQVKNASNGSGVLPEEPCDRLGEEDDVYPGNEREETTVDRGPVVPSQNEAPKATILELEHEYTKVLSELNLSKMRLRLAALEVANLERDVQQLKSRLSMIQSI